MRITSIGGIKAVEVLTDYPLFEHEYGKRAPTRTVHILDYDSDKYCEVLYEGKTRSIKRGYLYVNRRKISVSHRTLCRVFGKEL